MKLDLESIMSSPRMDLEKGWISFRIYLKILNFEIYHFKIFDSKKLFLTNSVTATAYVTGHFSKMTGWGAVMTGPVRTGHLLVR